MHSRGHAVFYGMTAYMGLLEIGKPAVLASQSANRKLGLSHLNSTPTLFNFRHTSRDGRIRLTGIECQIESLGQAACIWNLYTCSSVG